VWDLWAQVIPFLSLLRSWDSRHAPGNPATSFILKQSLNILTFCLTENQFKEKKVLIMT
jgi:hypothetical protein